MRPLRIPTVSFDVLSLGHDLQDDIPELLHLRMRKNHFSVPDALEQHDPPATRIDHLVNDLVAVHSRAGCTQGETILQHA
jgi:hypothetical protein